MQFDCGSIIPRIQHFPQISLLASIEMLRIANGAGGGGARAAADDKRDGTHRGDREAGGRRRGSLKTRIINLL